MFDPEKDEEAEQLLQQARGLITFYEAHRSALEAKGVDVDNVLAEARADVQALERACADVEKAEEEFLQSTADIADAELELFKTVSEVIDRMLEERPFDPEVQDMAERRDEWKKQFPSE